MNNSNQSTVENTLLVYTYELLFDKNKVGSGADSVKILTWNILAQTLSNFNEETDHKLTTFPGAH